MSTNETGQRRQFATENGDGERFAAYIGRLLSDARCENVLVLDLRGLSTITDYFVIGTGTSDRQMASSADDLKRLATQEGRSRLGSGPADKGDWVVCDYGDVIVHLFTDAMRSYYDLESLWADAPKLEWEAVTEPGQFANLGAQPSA